MSKFENLIKYISSLEGDDFGAWVDDRENDGSPEHPIQMSFINYSETADRFIADVYDFMDRNEEMELNCYADILNKNGLKWESKSMHEADVSKLDAQCVMALIIGAVRADRFSEGALLKFFQDGSVRKWLERLKELDE